MKKLFTLFLLVLAQSALAIDPYTLLLRQYDSTGLNQLAVAMSPPTTDSYLGYRVSDNTIQWYSASNQSFQSTQLSDSTAIGRALLTSTSQSSARSTIGAGTSNFSGAYTDLTGRPTNVSQFTNDSLFITASTAPVTSVNTKTGALTLNASDVGAAATSHTHTASQITDSTTIGRSLITATDQAAVKTIAGIPTAVSQLTNDSSYATTTALTSGLAGKFNIPTGTTSQYVRGDGSIATLPATTQVNSDWSATSGAAQILNKPAKYSGSTNGSGIYTVTYGSAYSAKPHLVFSVEGGTNKDTSVLTSTTTTGFSILVERRTDVVGLLPSYAAVSGITVNVTVTP